MLPIEGLNRGADENARSADSLAQAVDEQQAIERQLERRRADAADAWALIG